MLCVNLLYARYHISPARELQFGSVTLNSRKSRTFTIENVADKFEFKFSISAIPTDAIVVPDEAVPPVKEEKKAVVPAKEEKKSVVCISTTVSSHSLCLTDNISLNLAKDILVTNFSR